MAGEKHGGRDHGTARGRPAVAVGLGGLAFLFLLPALEAPAFLGLVLPGELALLLGGVLASQGRIPLRAAMAVGSPVPWPATQPAS